MPTSMGEAAAAGTTLSRVPAARLEQHPSGVAFVRAMRESRLVEARELEDELVRLVLFLLEPDAAPPRSV
jgi:hypothetical protein